MARVRVKMCGMTRREDIAHAINLGVDAIGLIFYSKSARCVSIEQAKLLLKDLPAFVDSVAVMVNPEQDFVHQILEELPIQLLQFHGDETQEFCQQFKKPFIKAIHSDSAEHIHQAARNFVSARALLLDTPSETVRGGLDVFLIGILFPKSLKSLLYWLVDWMSLMYLRQLNHVTLMQ